MVTTRHLAPDDLGLVCRHREAMFRASGRHSEAVLAEMAAAFGPWLEPRLRDGSYFGFVAESGGEPVGGIGLMLIDWPPHPSHPGQHRRGYVLNVFVEPPFRRQGVGRRLMELGEAELRRRGVAFAVLHASRMGRPGYERLGWAPSSEMGKSLA